MKAIKEILNRWKKEGKHSFSTIERCFDLNVGSLEGWRTGKIRPDVGALPLLRIIDTYPWMTLVANSNYDGEIARKVMTLAGLNNKREELQKELQMDFGLTM